MAWIAPRFRSPIHNTGLAAHSDRPLRAQSTNRIGRELCTKPALERAGDFAKFPGADFDEASAYSALRRAETVGRSIGSAAFVKTLEQKTGRTLSPAQRSRKKGISKLSP